MTEFDHRSSIIRYMESQAGKYDAQGNRDEATALRAAASSVKAMIDVEVGQQEIASPVTAIVLRLCGHFGEIRVADVLGKCQTEVANRTRFAAMWVAKKRLGWSSNDLAPHFRRDQSTVSHGVARAEQIRAEDESFRIVTDELVEDDIRCENCQHSLLT